MIISFGQFMTLKTRYLQQRGSVFQFVMRVPSDLADRYGKASIRQSLETTDPKEAIRKVNALAKKYLAQFKLLQESPKLAPASVTVTAREIAEAYGTLDCFIDQVIDPIKNRYYRGDSQVDVSSHLSSAQVEAGVILGRGLDVICLSDAIKLYWKSHKKAGDASFVVGVERDWGKLVSFLGDIPVMDLSRLHARQFVEHLSSAGLKTASVRRNLNHVIAVLNSAIIEGEITKSNPFNRLQIANEGEDSEETNVPTETDLHEIIVKYRQDESLTALLALILIETGTRIAEFSGMKASDVFLDAPIPYVRIKDYYIRGTKNKDSLREFPVVGVSLEALKKVMAMPRSTDAVFPTYARIGGGTAASAAVNKRLTKWDITSHSFRHSLKDRLREAGCPKDIRDRIAGHKAPDIAETYGKGFSLEMMHSWLIKAQVKLSA